VKAPIFKCQLAFDWLTPAILRARQEKHATIPEIYPEMYTERLAANNYMHARKPGTCD